MNFKNSCMLSPDCSHCLLALFPFLLPPSAHLCFLYNEFNLKATKMWAVVDTENLLMLGTAHPSSCDHVATSPGMPYLSSPQIHDSRGFTISGLVHLDRSCVPVFISFTMANNLVQPHSFCWTRNVVCD